MTFSGPGDPKRVWEARFQVWDAKSDVFGSWEAKSDVFEVWEGEK